MTTLRLDRDALRAALLGRLSEFLRAYVAPDTAVRECGHEIRIGSKGSIAVTRDQGLYFDFERGRGGDVFELARVLTGARDFQDTLRRVADFAGTGAATPGSIVAVRRYSRARTKATNTRTAARQIWNATLPIVGTLAAAYLDARGVGYVASAGALRFHPQLSHQNAVERFPALVAGVQGVDGQFMGIQRTYLDGARKAAVEPARASLGSLAGGAVRLAQVTDDNLLVAEGIETTAAAVKVIDWPGGAWSTLSTSGLRAVVLPAEVRRVVIAADRDRKGAGQREAAALARRLKAEGRQVYIWLPDTIGHDFCDELNGGGRHGHAGFD